jgi:hypothetical protein
MNQYDGTTLKESQPKFLSRSEPTQTNGHSDPKQLKYGRQAEAPGVILIMQRDLFKHGHDRAISSGALAPNKADEETLQEHAQAMAREAYREAFDPTKHPQDEMLDTEYRKNLSDRADAEHGAKFAEADVSQREEDLARAHPGSPPPKPPPALIVAAIVATTITVAPTLHDTVFLMDDDFISWTLSLACGLFVGLLIALMIVGDTDATGHRSITNWIGLSAGILVSLALGALRVGAAKTVGDLVFAAGMTVLELGIVLALEGVATRRRAAMSEWSARNSVAEKATAALDAAKARLERWKERLGVLNQAITHHINYVGERALRNMHIDQIEATAFKAVRDGYLAGIADNRGHVLGAGKRDKS